eukprot:gnl/Trimastix_PCT/1286.p2 GENE.gnl/Trimastix_PCT/1286~~gnl/Trimastix_PCT/1286.p2  ORF type:complete len:423 (+),score=149.48 gnl/Trimastix_PCT/1286:27-1295(+)
MAENEVPLEPHRWASVYNLLEKKTALSRPDFEPGDDNKEFLHSCNALVIGAGGLGCEILKDLALTGFKRITVIDMDTIDVSNLNRQFLFTGEDVGKSKAVVAAQFINERVEGCHVEPYFGKIQDKDADFYADFDIVIAGLDSIQARRWLNGMLCQLAQEGSIIPLVDGGSEGFNGQSRVILPTVNACFECAIETITPQVTFPFCTISVNPRLPEHCIEFAIHEFPKHHDNRKADGDIDADVAWLYDFAERRAGEFGIEGVTERLTLGVLKNIIPAVASTNAIIAASCVNEALKLVTNAAYLLDNYMQYSGTQGTYAFTFQYGRNERCVACSDSAKVRDYPIDPATTLEQFMERLAEDPLYQFKRPGITTARCPIYLRIMQHTHDNLRKPMRELVEHNEQVSITDPCLPDGMVVTLQIQYPDE